MAVIASDLADEALEEADDARADELALALHSVAARLGHSSSPKTLTTEAARSSFEVAFQNDAVRPVFGSGVASVVRAAQAELQAAAEAAAAEAETQRLAEEAAIAEAKAEQARRNPLGVQTGLSIKERLALLESAEERWLAAYKQSMDEWNHRNQFEAEMYDTSSALTPIQSRIAALQQKGIVHVE